MSMKVYAKEQNGITPYEMMLAQEGEAVLEGKLDKSQVANNLTTTEEGYALDARQGKALNDMCGFKLVRRWVNPAPTSSFPAQTISIPNLSSYPIIAIDFMTPTGTVQGPLQFILIAGRNGTKFSGAFAAFTENIVTRYFTVNTTNNTIAFGLGSKMGDVKEYNVPQVCIPAAVYSLENVSYTS